MGEGRAACIVGASLDDARKWRENGLMKHGPLLVRQTGQLHTRRSSEPEARYFVTLVTRGREPWLGVKSHAEATLGVMQDWHREGDGLLLAATIMPDHAHVLFELGRRLTVGQCVGRWKTEARKATGYTEEWQRDFWEHRLRAEEDAEEYALYTFLNPYRARLVGAGETWPWWWAPEMRRFKFAELLGSKAVPPQEWIDWPDERFAGVSAGE